MAPRAPGPGLPFSLSLCAGPVRLLLFLFLLAASAGAQGAHATYVGGAPIAAPLEDALIKAFRKATGVSFDNYSASSAQGMYGPRHERP